MGGAAAPPRATAPARWAAASDPGHPDGRPRNAPGDLLASEHATWRRAVHEDEARTIVESDPKLASHPALASAVARYASAVSDEVA